MPDLGPVLATSTVPWAARALALGPAAIGPVAFSFAVAALGSWDRWRGTERWGLVAIVGLFLAIAGLAAAWALFALVEGAVVFRLHRDGVSWTRAWRTSTLPFADVRRIHRSSTQGRYGSRITGFLLERADGGLVSLRARWIAHRGQGDFEERVAAAFVAFRNAAATA